MVAPPPRHFCTTRVICIDVTVPPRGKLEVRSSDAEHTIAVYNPLALAYFTRPPMDVELGLLRELTNEAKAQKIKAGLLIVIARRDMKGGIQPKVREFFEEMVRKNAENFGASAAVILMQGFGGSLMRSFLTSLLLIAGRRKLLQIFATVSDACDWLAPQHQLDPAALKLVFDKAIGHIARAS
jgi:hypothetical protein